MVPILLSVFLSILLIVPVRPQAAAPGNVASPALRDPFTVKLRIDKDRNYEQHFEKIPYVADKDVYLFSGDHFGINVTVSGDEISGVTYQPVLNKADVELKFTQEKASHGRTMMMLVIKNKLKRPLFLHAWMTVPGKDGKYNTSILPVRPGLAGFESWPQPIVQLVLTDLRFDKL